MKYHTFYTNKDARRYRYTNYRVAVGLLVGQGWEPKRPTLSYQKTNRYAVVSITPLTCTWFFINLLLS